MVATTRRRKGTSAPLTDSFRCVSGPLPLAVMGERLRLVSEMPTWDVIQAYAGARSAPASLLHPWRRGSHAVAAAFHVGART
jgi:hypothetical protein